jgi:hypothetical protein
VPRECALKELQTDRGSFDCARRCAARLRQRLYYWTSLGSKTSMTRSAAAYVNKPVDLWSLAEVLRACAAGGGTLGLQPRLAGGSGRVGSIRGQCRATAGEDEAGSRT